MHIEVETRNVDGRVTSLGMAEQFTLVVDRPTEGGGGGLGFKGGQLLYLAVGGNFVGEPAVSDEILYEVEVKGDAPEKSFGPW